MIGNIGQSAVGGRCHRAARARSRKPARKATAEAAPAAPREALTSWTARTPVQAVAPEFCKSLPPTPTAVAASVRRSSAAPARGRCGTACTSSRRSWWDPGRAYRDRWRRSTGSTSAIFRSSMPYGGRQRAKARRSRCAKARGEALMKGESPYRRDDGRRGQPRDAGCAPRDGSATASSMDVPSLHGDADHHRRGGQHRADAGGQGATSCRTPSISATRCASGGCASPSCRRWRRSTRRCRSTIEAAAPVQDGRPRPDHRRRSSTARSRSTTRSTSRPRKIKKIDSPVAGRANVLVVPDLEAGNMLAKSLSFLAGADAAGIVLGARVPIILTSRADLGDDAPRLVRASPRWSRKRGASGRARRWPDRGGRHRRFSTPARRASSSRFSTGGERPAAVRRWHGSRRGLLHAPRFVAKDADGKTRRREELGAGRRDSVTTAHSRISVGFLREPLPRASSSAPSATGSFTAALTSCGAGARRRRRARARSRSCIPLAPLHQPHNLAPIRRSLERLPRIAAGRLLRHRIPSHPAGSRAGASRCRGRLPIAACALRLPRHCPTRYIAGVLPTFDPKAAAGKVVVLHLGNGASMCAMAGRAQHGEHHGLHRGRRLADGHALPATSIRASCSTCWTSSRWTRARSRSCSYQRVGTAGRVGHFERHAHAGGQQRGPVRGLAVDLFASTGSAASWARSRPRSGGLDADRVHRRDRREQPLVTRTRVREAAWLGVTTRRRRECASAGHASARAASQRAWRRGSFRPTRN